MLQQQTFASASFEKTKQSPFATTTCHTHSERTEINATRRGVLCMTSTTSKYLFPSRHLTASIEVIEELFKSLHLRYRPSPAQKNRPYNFNYSKGPRGEGGFGNFLRRELTPLMASRRHWLNPKAKLKTAALWRYAIPYLLVCQPPP